MNRSSSRRYASNEPSAQDLKPANIGNNLKRRALGDITNSFAPDENKDIVLKKPIITTASNNVPSMEISEPAHPEFDEEDTAMQEAVDDRVYMQRPHDDIDSRDSLNPVLATSCVVEMYTHFHEAEMKFAVNSVYMSSQPFVNERMRAILIDWLVSLAYIKFCKYFRNKCHSIRLKCT
jgi:hypothetical protein